MSTGDLFAPLALFERGAANTPLILRAWFDSRAPPQHGQTVGPGTTMRSRGRCAGNG